MYTAYYTTSFPNLPWEYGPQAFLSSGMGTNAQPWQPLIFSSQIQAPKPWPLATAPQLEKVGKAKSCGHSTEGDSRQTKTSSKPARPVHFRPI